MVIYSDKSTSMVLLVERGFSLAKTLASRFDQRDWAGIEIKTNFSGWIASRLNKEIVIEAKPIERQKKSKVKNLWGKS